MKSRNKDNKPHESIIGKIIYGFLLFMPLLAIGVTCAYAIFNKNAYQSYYGETVNEETIKPVENFNENTLYTLNYNGDTLLATNVSLYIDTITFYAVPNNNVTTMNDNADNIISLYFFQNNNIQYCVFRDINNNAVGSNIPLSNSLFNFDYKWINNSSNTDINNWLKNYSTYIEYNSYSFVSEVFYYSINKVQQSPLFNWAENSAIHTGMATTCNALNITTPFIPLLMTYWLIISVIYILYDIILVILHIFHKKIHQLEDSF